MIPENKTMRAGKEYIFISDLPYLFWVTQGTLLAATVAAAPSIFCPFPLQ